jgi:murein DD-endopeptidase MepM/ murein hydrolase activator NlpD
MYPVKAPYKITSPFGAKRTLPNGYQDVHSGIDIVNVGHKDKTLIAVCDGVVIDDKDDYNPALRWDLKAHNTVGNRFVVRSVITGKTVYWSLYHTATNTVKIGDRIAKGQVVGEYGDVGYSFGPHVHLQAWDSAWKIIDPGFLLTI